MEGQQNCICGSKVMVNLLKWLILPGGVVLGRVCTCSLRSRLVLSIIMITFCNVLQGRVILEVLILSIPLSV